MKYKYKILWFEDNHEQLKERCEPPLRAYLDTLGFDLTIEWEPAKLTTSSPEKEYKKFDLIVTDLNLSEDGPKDTAGVEILTQIRNYKILTDVLIYSSSPDHLARSQELLKNPPERVSFCGGQNDLTEKVQKLIDLGIRKAQTIENIRGLVIAEAIELEFQIGELTHEYFSRLEKNREKSKLARAKDFKKKKIAHAQKSLTQIRALDPNRLQTFCKNPCLGAFDQLMLLTGIIKDAQQHCADESTREPSDSRKTVLENRIKDLAFIATDLKNFNADVIAARNTLAHVKEHLDGDVVKLKSRSLAGKETVIDHDWCVKIRKAVRKHAKNVVSLNGLL